MSQLITTTEEAPARLAGLGITADRLPRHVAIIMDGNGRWAVARGMPRVLGHRNGIASVRAVVEECCRLGIGHLTLFCLSSENWKRPPREIRFLMRLLRRFLIIERAEMMEQGIRLRMIGDRDGLPDEVLREMDRSVAETAGNPGLTLSLAVNYGSRAEIAGAARRMAVDVRSGRLDPEGIDERSFADYLWTAELPDPDLLIRTAGEMRLSNYLLWQVSYAEFWVTDVLWPDFRAEHLHAAVLDFARRRRTYGGLSDRRGLATSATP